MAAWDACGGPVPLEPLRGRPCFGGLDLSTTTDVSALTWVFPPGGDDDLWRVLSRYFVPAENLRRRAERDRVPYDFWAAQSFIEATAGNVVDYGAIEERIRADSSIFDIREIAYDPWNATHIALRLQDEGANMIEFRQGFRSMAAEPFATLPLKSPRASSGKRYSRSNRPPAPTTGRRHLWSTLASGSNWEAAP